MTDYYDNDDLRHEPADHAWSEAPHADPSTLRSAYAFDGSGPYLYAPDGSGPYTYTHDGRGPYLMGSPAAQGYGARSPFGPAADADHHRRRRIGLAIGSSVAALAVLGAAGGTAFGLVTRPSDQTTSSGSGGSSSQSAPSIPGYGGFGNNGGSGSTGGNGAQPGTGAGTGTGTESGQTAATAAEKTGLVTIVSQLDYSAQSEAAGTGMILTSDGKVLTNNHVIEGATAIQVTVQSTGKTYTAKVIGEDKTDDVAVLQLQDASGLTPVTLGTNDKVTTGETVTDVGNAEGQGQLVAASGSVIATGQSITVQSDSGSGSESLKNLIEVSADVVSGDSGGPVLNSSGDVIGMATAASSGTANVTGYAIPITTASSIANQIIAGKSSTNVMIGLPAFLGVEVQGTTPAAGGVQIAGVIAGSPAAAAGLATGDVITAVDGTAVTSANQLTSLIQSHSVGSTLSITYTSTTGTSATVSATLVAGPAA